MSATYPKTGESPAFSQAELEEVHRRLSDWFEANARDVVWRTPDTSPWGVLLSEVMSQQTPVARVEPKWVEWITRWPTPAHLARADTAEVLRAWDNLGYPRRALRLKECARVIVDKHGGEVPSDVDALLALPGIGDYTARAVAAFAFHQGVPVVDTNVRRVYVRLVAGSYLTPPARKRELIDVAELLPRTNAWKFSLALMELGALVCTPAPKCELCPLEGSCAWRTRLHARAKVRTVSTRGVLRLARRRQPRPLGGGTGSRAQAGAEVRRHRPPVPGADHGAVEGVATPGG